jgi:large subunit ribosomal protein L31e
MERTYTIPLRKAFLKAPTYLRTNRAVREVRSYLTRHMKSANVKLGEELNKTLWARGDSKPPHHVTVVAKKEDDVVYAELAGKDFVKKDFSAKEDEKPAKKASKPAKETKTEEHAAGQDPAELIGKAATAKAKAEGKVKQ